MSKEYAPTNQQPTLTKTGFTTRAALILAICILSVVALFPLGDIVLNQRYHLFSAKLVFNGAFLLVILTLAFRFNSLLHLHDDHFQYYQGKYLRSMAYDDVESIEHTTWMGIPTLEIKAKKDEDGYHTFAMLPGYPYYRDIETAKKILEEKTNLRIQEPQAHRIKY
tara:strand:+ start:418 stop:915 length:498 start_codon:yes stop_codon:yes gene_type:complete